MIDFNKIMDDYVTFLNSLNHYRVCKNNTHNFYMEHFDEIEDNLDKYYEYINDQQKLDKLFKKHQALKDFITLNMIKDHYKEKMDYYSVSPEINKFGKSVICIVNTNVFILYDLDSYKKYFFETNDIKIAKYIEIALKKLNKFVSRIYLSEINVTKVIYSDLKETEGFTSLESKKQCKKIENELNKARMFDDSYIVDGKDVLPINLDDEYRNLICLYKDKKISKDEYYKRFYFCRIISGENIEQMFKRADDEQKEYIMQVYIELSSDNYNKKGKVHIRTTSDLINQEVLNRRNKN